MKNIIIKQKPLLGIFYIFMSLLITFLSLFITFLKQEGLILQIIFSTIGVLGIILFGLGTLYFFKRTIEGRTLLIVDSKGITDNTSFISVGFIPWKDIKSIIKTNSLNQKFISIDVKDNNKYITKLSKLKTVLINKNFKLGYPLVNITLNGTGLSRDTIYEEIIKIYNKVK